MHLAEVFKFGMSWAVLLYWQLAPMAAWGQYLHQKGIYSNSWPCVIAPLIFKEKI